MSPDRYLYNEKEEPSFEDIKFDNAAFEAFFKEYFKPLCAYCEYKFGFDLDLAKETVHTGFIRLWENRKAINPDLSPRAYMYRIVTNVSLDILKHQKVKRQHEKYVIENMPAGGIMYNYNSTDFKELKNNIDKAVFDLPEKMREIFELNRYQGLKYSEIANHLGISVKTVETQMSRAMVKLRQKLAQYLPLFFMVFMNNL